MAKKKIFISGIAGFLGSHLADVFIAEGHHVVGCDNLVGGSLKNVPSEAEFYRFDCNDLKAMIKITKEVDIVYHCAALAYEGLSVFSPFIVTNSIVGASVGVFTAAINNKAKRIVLCSSMARYGKNKVPFTEDMKPCPQDPYGIGKYSSELYLRNMCETHGVEYVIAVPHNIIGPRQKYDDPYRNVASIMINLMLQGMQPIIYGNGAQKRCFSSIYDCLDVLQKMAFEDNVIGEVINIGPDEEFVTINELTQIIANLLEFELNPIYLGERPQEVMYANCSVDKARRLLGYKTKHTLRNSLKELIDYIKKEGPKPFEYHISLEIINEKTPDAWIKRIF
ncbi:MAG: NAD-dependent epimerase/dehydratase family protein [Candidatus Aminicenantaceae bacterium]